MPKFFNFLYLFIFLEFHVFSQLDDFIYNGFKQPNPNLILSGAANIKKNGILQLTNNDNRVMGHALISTPLQFKNSINSSVNSFSTCFAFNIVGKDAYSGGHGLAFTIAPSQDFIKSAFHSQYLGLLSATNIGNFSNHLFAVEFDTVKDIEFGDIDNNHVGININSLESSALSSAAAYFADSYLRGLTLKSGKTVIAWIEYDSHTNMVNVTMSTTNSKPKVPLLSYQVDLSPIFEKSMYIGFSSSTGLFPSSHYILGWSFKFNGNAKALDLNSLPSLPNKKKKSNPILIIMVSVLSSLVLIALVFLAISATNKFKNRDVVEDWELEIGPHRFSYKELKIATRGFKSELLGVGGFGKVYKGVLPSSNLEVAVKRISNESKQGLREFVSEISTIGTLRHRNLVQLQGWCRRRNDLLLVYDYMPNSSLDRFLFEKSKLLLNWHQRFNIIKGVAAGLFYLHEGYQQIVIHRDIKASNVLLDGDFNGRIGDFGMAKSCGRGENPTTTRLVGTLGYLAPELPRTGRATTSSDVFAFGALLLEVVCGRRPIENKAPPEEYLLLDLVWDKWIQGRPFDVVDEKLKGEFDENEVVLVMKLGLICMNNVAKMRPSMKHVMRYLEGEAMLPDVVRPPVGYYDGGEGGFEDYINSFVSSSLDHGSLYSEGTQVEVGLSFTSISTSPMPLFSKKGEAS